MKVEHLIKELEKYPNEVEVVIPVNGDYFLLDIADMHIADLQKTQEYGRVYSGVIGNEETKPYLVVGWE